MVRTRFAPSPTGYMHIGNLRTALYEFLIAKSNGGKFILRIEDTDMERFVEGSVEVIYNTLNKTGLIYDEGPGKPGGHEPYVQSMRQHIYIEYAKRLIEKKAAYYCFCTKERIDSLRSKSGPEDFKYDRHCLHLTQEEINQNLQNNTPFVIRQKMPDTGETAFVDRVYGSISVPNTDLSDTILIKSSGLPTYNFANVVDDHLMEITHVVRGSEYLSSTPKYNLLYDAFGWDIPEYIHLPPVMKSKTEKLSKRNGDASFEDLLEMGFLPEAIINYIALLGWSPAENKEIFSLSELIECFDINGLSKSPAIFDIKKLTWMNSEYFKNMDDETFFALCQPLIKKFIKADIDGKKLSQLLKSRLEVLNDIESITDFIDALPDYSPELYIHKKMKTTRENSLQSLQATYDALQKIDLWNEENIHNILFGLVETMQVKNSILLWPLRTALSGKPQSPGGGVELAYLLGKEETLKRIQTGIEKLRV